MSLLTRIAQKIFGTTGTSSEFSQIGSKRAGAPVKTKDLELMQTLAQYAAGLNAIVSDQGTSVLPYLEDLNSLFYLITSQLAYLMQSGIPEWNDETEYYQGVSLVLYDGEILIDLYGTPGTPNLNFEPDTNPLKWKILSSDYLFKAQNLADLPNASTARSNLDVYSEAESDSGGQVFTNKSLSGDSNTITEVASIKDQGGIAASGLKCKVIAIGDWDMNATANISIPHGLIDTSIRGIICTIRDDLNIAYYDFAQVRASDNGTGGVNTAIGNVLLNRTPSGAFDSANFSSTSYNRGWVTIWYEA